MDDMIRFEIVNLPKIVWQPILSVPEELRIERQWLFHFSVHEVFPQLPELNAAGLRHYAIKTTEHCHKQQSILLFVLALKILTKNQVASNLWLIADSRTPEEPLHLQSQTLKVSTEVTTFLQQAGFVLTEKNKVSMQEAFAILYWNAQEKAK